MSKKSILYPIQFVLLLAVLFLNSCSGASTKSKENNASQSDGLKIYAFHGTRQCTTCKNMKAYTKATLDKYFKNEMKSGKIVYKIIDVDDEANYAIAEKFEASGTALMINNVSNKKDDIEDWSDFAFQYAPGSQAEYERELQIRISQKLK